MAKSKQKPNCIQLSGLADSQVAPVLAERLSGEYRGRACLVITASTDRAEALAKALGFFSDRNIHTVAEDAPYFFDYESEAKSRDEANSRVRALIALAEDAEAVVVAAASGAMRQVAALDAFVSASFGLAVGGETDPADMPALLTGAGYSREHMVEAVGQYSVRGDILDLWPPNMELPIRVSFFGDEVEHIRAFDPATQRSGVHMDRVRVYPASEQVGGGPGGPSDGVGGGLNDSRGAAAQGGGVCVCNMAGYLPDSGIVVMDDAERIAAAIELRETETREDFAVLLERGECSGDALDSFSGVADIPLLFGGRGSTGRGGAGRETLFFTPCAKFPSDAANGVAGTGSVATKSAAAVSDSSAGGGAVRRIKPNIVEEFAAKSPAVMNGHIPLLLSELKRYIKSGFDITVVCSTDGRLANLRELLADEDMLGDVLLVRGELASGIEITTAKKVWLWDGDIFKAGRSGRRRKRYSGEGAAISSFSDIAPGDYVVHEAHGIGKYEGLDRLEIQGAAKDYLKIRYSGGDHLYVPVEQMSLIQKYIGGGAEHLKMNKLSGGAWAKAKARARADIAHMAADLAALAAERRTVKGHAFEPDTEWQMEFEDRFPYDETDDQLKAIASIKADMEKPQPMDRLLCGDVGYGKTEVALRAVFKCAADGKQAAILVPTTLLASQHYATFAERFEDFPFTVEMLSRFRTAAEQKKITSGIAGGRVDVVIGTHRLLSGDIAFKDLGLLVVDEEHRFGVAHKEKIKTLKKNVDVLSLTATPIPRTLHMSLLGVRDMDLIEEPPEDRYPVQTYVMGESPEIIRETIRRELDRGGQVFAVVSRISAIDRVAREITRLVPEARVAVGHGQMGETALEDTMADFIEGRSDVLISTTIIESGLDIPNANTVLVFDADKFGLSQLYQIRGRVGRASRMAFAYLLHKQGKQLSEVAEKRLRTIREFAEFGAGFRIAMRDLEIRGAGNLLGPEQHGHMAAIGYELYCRLVDEAVRAIANKSMQENAAQKTEPKLDLAFDAFIPESYIADESDRLETYHRIARIATEDDANGMADELNDRYGAPPTAVTALLKVSLARALASAAGEKTVRAATLQELNAAIENLKTAACMVL